MDHERSEREPPRLLSGRYELRARIGAGGAGVVWRALDLVLDRPVAVKLLHAELATEATTRARFHAEAATAAKLTHPNAVILHDIGRDGEHDYLVMELVAGTTLARLLEAGPLPAELVAALGHQIGQGLGAAHGRGLVHRDVKPANVLVTEAGVAKVVDFGIAQALGEATSRLTQPGHVMGTARYLAPEQLRDEGVDERADVYALGLLLHQAVTGEPPFGSGTAVEIAMRRLTGNPRSLRDRDLPTELVDTIERATALEPHERFSAAAPLADALAPLVAADATAQLAERVSSLPSHGSRAAMEPTTLRAVGDHTADRQALAAANSGGGAVADDDRGDLAGQASDDVDPADIGRSAPAVAAHGAGWTPAATGGSGGGVAIHGAADAQLAGDRPPGAQATATDVEPAGGSDDESATRTAALSAAPASAAAGTGPSAEQAGGAEADPLDAAGTVTRAPRRRRLVTAVLVLVLALGAVPVLAGGWPFGADGSGETASPDDPVDLGDVEQATPGPDEGEDEEDEADDGQDDGDDEDGEDEDGEDEDGEAGSVAITDVGDHDPFGSGEEHSADVANAVDADPATAWQTSRYRGSPELGGLKPGVGIWLDLEEVEEVLEVTVATDRPGASFEVYAGDGPPDGGAAPADWGAEVASVSGAGEQETVAFEEPVEAGTLLLWLTELPSDGGQFRGAVSDVDVVGR